MKKFVIGLVLAFALTACSNPGGQHTGYPHASGASMAESGETVKLKGDPAAMCAHCVKCKAGKMTDGKGHCCCGKDGKCGDPMCPKPVKKSMSKKHSSPAKPAAGDTGKPHETH